MFTDLVITDTIDKFSPYYINLRKMQQMQMQGIDQFGVHGVGMPDAINVHGQAPVNLNMNTPHGLSHEDADLAAKYGVDPAGPRQNIGITAWGARSDNVHGTYADNAWGTSTDNVWGTNSTDVWGGIGAGGLWGNKGVRMWGTGGGTNYIKPLTNFIMGLFAGIFGITNRKNREALRQMNALTNAYRNSANNAAANSGSTRGAPTTTRTR